MAPPVMCFEEHIWNFRVLQRVHLSKFVIHTFCHGACFLQIIAVKFHSEFYGHIHCKVFCKISRFEIVKIIEVMKKFYFLQSRCLYRNTPVSTTHISRALSTTCWKIKGFKDRTEGFLGKPTLVQNGPFLIFVAILWVKPPLIKR
jgi:hypothetical protein